MTRNQCLAILKMLEFEPHRSFMDTYVNPKFSKYIIVSKTRVHIDNEVPELNTSKSTTDKLVYIEPVRTGFKQGLQYLVKQMEIEDKLNGKQ